MLAAASPLVTPLCHIGILAQPIMCPVVAVHEAGQRAQSARSPRLPVVRVDAAAADSTVRFAQVAQASQVESVSL